MHTGIHRTARSACLLLMGAICWADMARGSQGPAATHGQPSQVSAARRIACELADLVRARLDIMPEVARWKWNAGQPVHDPRREAALLQRLVQRGRALGLNEELARRFFRSQLAASRGVQQRLFAQWRETGAGRFDQVADLRQDLRPQIDRLSENLLQSLARAAPELECAAFREMLRELVGQALPAEVFGDAVRLSTTSWLPAARPPCKVHRRAE